MRWALDKIDDILRATQQFDFYALIWVFELLQVRIGSHNGFDFKRPHTFTDTVTVSLAIPNELNKGN